MKNDTAYQETIPVFVHYLGVLAKLIERGAKHARKTPGLSEEKLLAGRLAPDMFTCTQQVGYAYFMALEAACNLSGHAMPQFTYDEKSVRELRASLKRVILFLESIKPSEMRHSEKRRMKTFLDPKATFSRDEYVRLLALPNFFFHVVTAYDILRHLGVPLKKDHYLDR